MEDSDSISLFDLKQLLFELYEVRPDIKVKIRLSHESWTTNFLTITHLAGLTDNPPDFRGIIFNDEESANLVVVKDLNDITQFMLDKSYPGYMKNIEYSVKHTVKNI